MMKKTRRRGQQAIRTGLPLMVMAGWLQGLAPRADMFEDAVRATLRLTSGATSGTGFVIQQPGQGTSPPSYRLVTAAHVYEQMQGTTCQVVFRRAGDGGRFERSEVAVPIRENDQPLWTRHPEVDVAVLPLERPEGVDFHPFALSQVATEAFADDGRVRVGQDVCIPVFPAQLESNPAGWPVLRKGSVASHPLAPLEEARTFLVDAASFGGDSGAPVVAEIAGRATVIGLISGMQRQTDKATMPFEERTVHTPLGLGIAVPSAFIHQVLDREGAVREDE
jgi:hypothetical protein